MVIFLGMRPVVCGRVLIYVFDRAHPSDLSRGWDRAAAADELTDLPLPQLDVDGRSRHQGDRRVLRSALEQRFGQDRRRLIVVPELTSLPSVSPPTMASPPPQSIPPSPLLPDFDSNPPGNRP